MLLHMRARLHPSGHRWLVVGEAGETGETLFDSFDTHPVCVDGL